MTYFFPARLTGLLRCVCLSLAIFSIDAPVSGRSSAWTTGTPSTSCPSGGLTRPDTRHPKSETSSSDVCPRPELLQADQVTDSTARLTWSDVGSKYEIELVAGSDPFTGLPTYTVNADPPFDIAGLIPGRNYRFQVRTVCDDDTTSSIWSTPRSFITDLNNARPCPLNLDLRDTSCNNIQVFEVYVDDAPGSALGTDVVLQGVRIMVEHAWRSDLNIWLVSPDSTRIQLAGGLNAGDKNIGDPQGAPCAQFVEFTDNTAIGLPLSTAAEKDNITGYYLPVEALATLHTGQNPAGVWTLEICDSKAADKGKLRLFELVFARTDCAGVDQVTAANVTENSADIFWQADAPGDSLLIEYGPAGFLPGQAGTAGAGAAAIKIPQPAVAPLLLTGLQTLQQYEVYIRRQCAPGVWGPNSAKAGFFTNCTPTLLETVDTLPLCATDCPAPCPLPGIWQNVPGDDYEWKVYTGPGLFYPAAGPPAAPDGAGNYLYFRNSCSPTGAFGKTATLRTLCIDVEAPPTQACHFSFDLYMNTKIGQIGSLVLYGSTDGGQNWDSIAYWSGSRGKLWRREYVNLDAYHGQVALFQFVANGAFGPYGDIALDNIAFYGAQAAGTPDYEFFLDADGDSFGDPNVRVISCFPAAPPGYVAVDNDCDDSNPAVYPGAPEVLCNQQDENCNGIADDSAIPTPAAPANQGICKGQTAILTAPGTALGQYFWFAAAQGGTPLATGKILTLNNLTTPGAYTYYLADSLTGPSAGCSSQRVPVIVTVHPTPMLTLATAPSICDGSTFNLTTLPVADTANTGGLLSYHSATPPAPANQLLSSQVQPGLTTTYYILSTTSFGCTGTKAVTVTVLPSPEVQIAQGDSIGVCRGKTVQLLAAEGGVGMPPISYAWSTGLNFTSIPVQAGNTPNVTKTYSVTVTDANGCTGTDQIKVHTLNNITQTALVSVQDVSSCGGNDGSITLNPSNGTPPYTFAWPGGTVSGIVGVGTIPGLTQGSYRITVTDATNAGCSMVMPQIVLNAPGLDVSLDTILHPICPGVSEGSIVLNVNGQNPVYTWSNPLLSGPVVTALAAGSYSVTIIDGNCVQVLANLEVVGPSSIEINLNALQPVLCNGNATGSIDLAVFGATPPYTFAWSNDSLTEDLIHIPAGNYTSTITDANGCVFQSPAYPVTEPPLLEIQVDSLANVRCFGEQNGYVCIQATGGAGDYRFAWNTGATSPCLGAVVSGVYIATVTDANGCTAEWLGVVSQPSSLQIEFTDLKEPTCIGAKDGHIKLTISGGQPPFHFLWSNADTAAQANNLGVGPYKATISDNSGCTLISPVINLTAPQLLSVLLDSLVPVSCRGGSDGLIAVQVNGAVGNISTTWNGSPGNLTLSGQVAGTYVLQATDQRACSIKDTFVVTQPEAALSISVQQIKNALCAGEPTGSVLVRVSGGTTPYQYAWSNGAHTSNLPAVPAGLYGLTATDAKGCTVILPPVTVSEPPALTVAASIEDIPCFGPVAGNIQLQTDGGMPPYQYFWSNDKTSQNIFNLAAGSYSVTVLDATGCVNVLTDLTVKDLNVDFVLEPLTVLPVTCGGAADGTVIVQVINGKAPYKFSWSPPIGLHNNIAIPRDTAKQLSGGDYWVTVTDASGCTTVSDVFSVEEAPNLILSITNIFHNSCKGDSTGRITTNVSGGVPPYTYLWSNGTTQDSAQLLPAGSYRVTATDSRGCSAVSPPAQVLEPAAALSIVLDNLRQDTCGKQEGAIQLHVTGGATPYHYLWTNAAMSASLFGLSGGNYQLTVTDNLGCTTVSPMYAVQQLVAPLTLTDTTTVDVLCKNDSTGAIFPTFTGGTPSYQYAWSSGALTPTITNIPAGNYMLTLSDAAGCFNFWSFTVDGPAAALTATWTTDSLANGWTVTLTPSGGVPPYTIQWDAQAGNQTGPVATGLVSGYYNVMVTDDNGCSKVFGLVVGTSGAGDTPGVSNTFNLAPNPTGGLARLEASFISPVAVRVGIFSSTGQRLLQAEWSENINSLSLPIDLGPWPPGVYWITLQLSTGQIKTLSLVKKNIK